MFDEIDERILLARERTELAVERNRLANERTFLSWIRTGLASVAGGLAMLRFLTFQNTTNQMMSQAAGGILVLLGVAFFILSFFDYRSSYKKLKFQTGYAGSLWIICAISFTLTVVSVILLIIAFGVFKKI